MKFLLNACFIACENIVITGNKNVNLCRLVRQVKQFIWDEIADIGAFYNSNMKSVLKKNYNDSILCSFKYKIVLKINFDAV